MTDKAIEAQGLVKHYIGKGEIVREGTPAQLKADLRARSVAATSNGSMIFFPLLFLTPNFVPRDMLTRPMEIAATVNPVTYLVEALRSLILEDLEWGTILPGFGVVAGLGLVMLYLNVRMIERYD
jgi:ABC-2 type transport system permease protein